MCSDISTIEHEPTRQRPSRHKSPCASRAGRPCHGRKAVIVSLLLLAALSYTFVVFRHGYDSWQQEQQNAALALAGPIAEAVEQQLGEDPPQQILNDLVTPIFPADASLTGVRLLDQSSQVKAAVARPSAGQALQGFKVPVVAGVEKKLHDDGWVDTIGQLQVLEGEHALFIQELLADESAQVTTEVRQELYARQDSALSLAESMSRPDLRNAVAGMHTVLDTLTLEDKPISSVEETAGDVAVEITAVLTAYRSHVSKLPTLPPALRTAAPSPSVWAHSCPVVEGYQVLIPLFTPGDEGALVNHAGYLQVLVYAHPGEVLAVIGWPRLLPLGIMLLLAIVLAWPRRQQKRQAAT